VQKVGEPILTIYASYDVFLRKELPFGACINCTCIKVFTGINSL